MTGPKATPVLLAILVCDQVIRDQTTHKVTLVGLFDQIKAPKFPCVHHHLHIFVSLTNGHGQYPAELRVTKRDTGEKVCSLSGAIDFPSPLAVVDMTFDIPQVNFREPGRYSLDFYCDGEPVGSRPFEVAQQATQRAET